MLGLDAFNDFQDRDLGPLRDGMVLSTISDFAEAVLTTPRVSKFDIEAGRLSAQSCDDNSSLQWRHRHPVRLLKGRNLQYLRGVSEE
jgi:hypothetical protein